MSKIKLTGDTSGYIEISAPNVAANNTLELGSGTKILTNLDNVFTGVTTYSGNIDLNANLDLGDNNKILLGTGDDIEIFHNGTDSFVRDVGTGSLYIDSTSGEVVLRVNDTENAVVCRQNAEVELYHNGSQKFETTTTGAIVTGTLVSGSVTSELDLTAISSSISDTAVDIFVYDTRKDSDGGAWRKRTQHTSWYNETLGTATRGSRKEFPAVAVIVAENDTLTIYDGDDPDLPMWMVFNAGNANGNNMIGRTTENTTCTSMLNGLLCVGREHFGFHMINFIADRARFKENGYDTPYTLPIGTNRNGGNTWLGVNVDGNDLVNDLVNDVAMTVLPNAPVDDTTGLPVPTIAVGTNDGVSVIKDDGTVMSTASSSGGYYIKKVDFTDDHGLNAHIDSNSGGNKGLVYVDNIDKLNGLSYGTYANWDGVLYSSRYATNVLTYKTPGNGSAYPVSDFISMSGTDAAVGSNFTDGGLTLLAKNNESTGQGMVAFVTSDFNTGYQHGDIKGAFLSDTDTTNAVAAYYDDFANNDKGWGFVNTSISGGNMVITQQSQARSTDPDALSHVSTGVKLVFTGTVSGSGTGTFIIDDDGAGAGQGGTTTYGSVTSTGSFTFTATKTGSPRIRIMRTTGSNDYNINFLNISTEYDRSLNNKGLGVYGTITKSAVATGADLVAYSGFSGNNYLRQPHNADLNVGTGDFYIMCWAKGNRYFLWHRNDSGSLDMRCEFPTSGGSANRPRFYMSNGGVTIDFYATIAFDTTTWHHCVWVKRGARNGELYIDGVLNNSGTAGSDLNLNGTNSKFTIGNRSDNPTEDFNGYISLFRFGASAPSPEQIKKIYEDEKVLFQENAKATLYGSSDAVTALGYDEDTELLHVGTSSGRSDFQGLRRINNTTTAVTTAISASDDLIAEQ